MLVLSRAIGLPIRAVDGAVLGRLVDLTARLGVEHPSVHRLGIGTRRRLTHLLPWAAVAAYDGAGFELREDGLIDAFAVDDRNLRLEDDELLLVRDVLDTQIIDVVGHRMSRVSDVILNRVLDGRLELVAVNVGMAAIFRRLGLRKLSARMPERAVDWRDLHLTSDRGHDIHLATPSAAVHRLDEAGLADLVTRLDLTSATEVLSTVGPERAAGAVARAHPEVGRRLMLALESDDAARVVERLPPVIAHRIRNVLRMRSPLSRRRFLRLRGWRMNRPLRRKRNHRPQAGA